MVSHLPPTQIFSSQTPVLKALTLSLAYMSTRTTYKTNIFICSRLLLWERVYRGVAQKRPWYISPSRGRCIATALHVLML
jgi:hypothetical protein